MTVGQLRNALENILHCMECQKAYILKIVIRSVLQGIRNFFPTTLLWRVRFFISEPSAAGGYNWLPAPLGWIWQTQGTQNSKEQQRLGRASSSWCLLSFAVKNPQIHNNHGCTTTINWFRRTCNESKITLYYWLYTMFMMQFTELLIVHFFPFLLLFFKACLFHWL